MGYLYKINTKDGIRYCLRRMDGTIFNSKYYKTAKEAWRDARRMKIKLINYTQKYYTKKDRLERLA